MWAETASAREASGAAFRGLFLSGRPVQIRARPRAASAKRRAAAQPRQRRARRRVRRRLARCGAVLSPALGACAKARLARLVRSAPSRAAAPRKVWARPQRPRFSSSRSLFVLSRLALRAPPRAVTCGAKARACRFLRKAKALLTALDRRASTTVRLCRDLAPAAPFRARSAACAEIRLATLRSRARRDATSLAIR